MKLKSIKGLSSYEYSSVKVCPDCKNSYYGDRCVICRPSEAIEHDISVHGVYIEKDGKRIDPKDFYKEQ